MICELFVDGPLTRHSPAWPVASSLGKERRSLPLQHCDSTLLAETVNSWFQGHLDTFRLLKDR